MTTGGSLLVRILLTTLQGRCMKGTLASGLRRLRRGAPRPLLACRGNAVHGCPPRPPLKRQV